MAQKTIISLLVITIVGAFMMGIYDAVQPTSASDALTDLAEQVTAAAPTTTAEIAVEPIVVAEAIETPVDTVQTQPVQQSQDMVGEPWMTDAVITALDDYGMTLDLPDGRSVYVELGPPTFWQSQNLPLAVNDSVFVAGFFNGDQVHAATVMLPDGSLLSLRNATGQPLWSGGSENGNAQNQSEPLAQVSPEDWVTMSGMITSISNSTLTLQTDDGSMTIQLGQQRFWQDQGVTLAVGDEIRALGIWQSSQFQVAEITKLQTGERIMLRDPNNRPLWAGPGSSAQSGTGQGQGNGGGNQSGNGNSNSQGNGGSGQGNQGKGNGGQGNGNGYRGGRGS